MKSATLSPGLTPAKASSGPALRASSRTLSAAGRDESASALEIAGVTAWASAAAGIAAASRRVIVVQRLPM